VNLKDIVRTVAPTIATALGGPLAGTAVAALSNKLLGKPDGKEPELLAAVASASPETLLKLKELDQEFAAKMGQLGIDLEKIEADDRASARNRQVALKDWVPNVLALSVMAMLFAMMGVMLAGKVVPVESRDAFNILLGMLEGSVLAVMNYEFGSSRSSKAKDEILGKVASQ
jgi:hypothetical protein